jgi:hypothetical protein
MTGNINSALNYPFFRGCEVLFLQSECIIKKDMKNIGWVLLKFSFLSRKENGV